MPGTRGADGDPLDAVVLWGTSTFPGVVLPCRALGIIRVDQREPGHTTRQRNDRIVALPVKSPRFDRWRSVRDVSPRLRRELEQFFVAVTALEGKVVRILGWHGRSAALQSIRQHRYREQEEWP